jgi:hypothetical protein
MMVRMQQSLMTKKIWNSYVVEASRNDPCWHSRHAAWHRSWCCTRPYACSEGPVRHHRGPLDHMHD